MTANAEKPIETLRQERRLEAGETVLLRTGIEEAKSLVSLVMHILERLYEEKPIVLYELATLARDRNHAPFGRSGNDLVELKLIQQIGNNNYTMHESIRNIVAAATDGNGMDMVLRSPFKQADASNPATPQPNGDET